jgi:hypothetical protein
MPPPSEILVLVSLAEDLTDLPDTRPLQERFSRSGLSSWLAGWHAMMIWPSSISFQTCE